MEYLNEPLLSAKLSGRCVALLKLLFPFIHDALKTSRRIDGKLYKLQIIPRSDGSDGGLASHFSMIHPRERNPAIACVHYTSGSEYDTVDLMLYVPCIIS